MSPVILPAVLSMVAVLAPPDVPLSFEKVDHAFQGYMGGLAELAQRWRRAAELINQGNAPDARALLSSPVPEALDHIWADRQDSLRKKARLHVFYESEWLRQHNCYQLSRWYLDAGHAALAAARLQDCTPPGIRMERRTFDRHYAQALFESGRFAEAAERYAALDTTRWSDKRLQEHAEWIATLRQYAHAYPQTSSPPCEHFVHRAASSAPNWKLGEILGTFRCLQGLDEARMREGLLRQFSDAHDDTARQLLLQLSATHPASEPVDAAAALLALGVDAHLAEDFATAFSWWQRVVDQYPNTPSWPKALFNTGTTLKEQRRYREAIGAFTRLRDAAVNDREPGAYLKDPYRNYRPRASWQISLCRLASGDPRGALADFHNTRDNFPFPRVQREYAYKYAAYEGICLEMLGSHDRAIASYFRAVTGVPSGGVFVARRIVDLYESAGRIAQLIELCDAVDAHFLSELRRRHPDSPAELPEERMPTARLRLILHIRDMGRAGQAAELIEMIDEGRGFGPDSPGDLRSNWRATEAARALAHKPDESFRLLQEGALAKHPKQRGWLCYAMSVVAPARAVRFVGDDLSNAGNVHHCATLAFTLQQCGQAGIAELDRIEKRREHSAHKSVRARLARWRRSEPDPWPELPGVPEGTLLPVRLAEIDEKVRLLESLPDSVTVDRSTPAKTLESWVMALRIADRKAYGILTTDSPRMTSIFDALCEPSDRRDARLLTYDLTEITATEMDRARARVTFHLGKSAHQLTIELSRADGGWRVEAVEESGR